MNNSYQGLTSDQARERAEKFGKNLLTEPEKSSFFKKLLHIIAEPMFLLLIAAAIIYFILGEPRDGIIMLIFVIGIISIDAIQEWKTDKTLAALKDLSAPHIKVIRDGSEQLILSSELVPGDLMMLQEGVKIPADGTVIKASDLCVDESSLTGEAEDVWKKPQFNSQESSGDYWRKDYCYTGTLVTNGSGYIIVDKIGRETEYGKIGENVASAPESPTPLQKQTGKLVKLCAGIAGVLFALVSLITFFNLSNDSLGNRIIDSILSGITLAMAMIPEEFPVILTVFLSMGAWRLAKKQSLVRRLPAVETLGAVSVLCVDKTGTITMNQMTVTDIWAADQGEEHLIEVMGLGCETYAYDPMEKAMLECCENHGISKEHLFGGTLITEYPFTDDLKMMGHVWHHDGERIIACKGSPERILTICMLSDEQRAKAKDQIENLSKKGLRVIGIAETHLSDKQTIPEKIESCQLTFCGLIGLSDPPRQSVKANIASCVEAGIRVVMITGDSGITASSIATQIGMPNADNIITGNQLNVMDDDELMRQIDNVNVFSRVVPAHKMRIVKAFQAKGHVVAMTGDGVNDAPALKHADIGIAMGKRGSEVSREAADLILMDDNFSTIVQTIKDGRRIYDNIKKAVGYVFSIHIPIALASLLAPFLRISPNSLLLLPLHVVLLELLIDPTCSIVLERQPAESSIMNRPPRKHAESLLTKSSLTKSIIQGLVIFAASFGVYLFMKPQANPEVARSMGLSVIMLANIFLVQVNSSNIDSLFTSLKRLSHDKVMWGVSIVTILALLLILYTPAAAFLKLSPLSLNQLLIAVGLGFFSVVWYEIVKWVKRLKKQN